MLRAASLFDLERPQDGLAVYDELIERYGEDETVYARARIAEALP